MARFDVGAGLAGAGSGAAIGGSVGGPPGAAIGAGIGGIVGLFASRSKKKKKISTLDKHQQALYEKYVQGIQGKGEFASAFGFNPKEERDVFNKSFAQPAYQNFKENVVPTITGQFRGGNLQNSSYLGGALSKAGTDVQRGLDAHLAQILQQSKQSSIDRRLNALNSILQTQTFAREQSQPGALDQALSGFAQGAGKYGAQAFSNYLNPTSNASTPAPGAASPTTSVPATS